MPDETKPEPSPRLKKRLAAMEAVKKMREPRRVRVNPRDEKMRRAMKHPRYGGFRSSGSIELPLDHWTRRRIREGSLVVEERERTAVPPRGPGRSHSGAGAPKEGESA